MNSENYRRKIKNIKEEKPKGDSRTFQLRIQFIHIK